MTFAILIVALFPRFQGPSSPPQVSTSQTTKVYAPIVLGPTALDVRAYGAKADGATDDTESFQKALNECGKSGGTVLAPAGRYLLKGTLTVPSGVTLEGSFQAPARPFRFDNGLAQEKGTILLTTNGKGDAGQNPFITLDGPSTIEGVVIDYPEQTFPVVPFPWCIRGRGDNCAILNTFLVNPYLGVDFGTHPCPRHFIDGLYGQPLKTGIFLDRCQDAGRIMNVHFWPFWSADKNLWAWTGEHAVAFEIGRADWEDLENCFSIFYSVGFHFISGPEGPGNAMLTNCGADTGPVAVRVDSVQLNLGVSFVNCQFASTVEVGQDNQGPVKFTNCGFDGIEGYTDEQARLRGAGQTTFLNCHFVNGSQLHKGSYAIDALSGGLTVEACEFLDRGSGINHIRIGEGVRTAIATGNTFRSPIRILNKSHGQVAIVANVTASP